MRCFRPLFFAWLIIFCLSANIQPVVQIAAAGSMSGVEQILSDQDHRPQSGIRGLGLQDVCGAMLKTRPLTSGSQLRGNNRSLEEDLPDYWAEPLGEDQNRPGHQWAWAPSDLTHHLLLSRDPSPDITAPDPDFSLPVIDRVREYCLEREGWGAIYDNIRTGLLFSALFPSYA